MSAKSHCLFPFCALLSTMAIALAASLSGCSSSAPIPNGPSAPAVTEHSEHAHDEPSHHNTGGQSDMEKMKVELAKLLPEDAASAERQHVCPVSGEMLGTMGAPEKIDVAGQQVWICCDGCREKLLASPDEYLAELKRE